MMTILLVRTIKEGGWCKYTGTYDKACEEWFAWAKNDKGEEFVLSSRQSLSELKKHIQDNYSPVFGVYDFTELKL